MDSLETIPSSSSRRQRATCFLKITMLQDRSCKISFKEGMLQAAIYLQLVLQHHRQTSWKMNCIVLTLYCLWLFGPHHHTVSGNGEIAKGGFWHKLPLFFHFPVIHDKPHHQSFHDLSNPSNRLQSRNVSK